MMRYLGGLIVVAAAALAGMAAGDELSLDERPAAPNEWGYRPAAGSESRVNPPAFCWRPQPKIVSWELECRSEGAAAAEYSVNQLEYNVHCPSRVFPPGTFSWRYRGTDARGQTTNWSQPRTFTIPPTAAAMPMPPREELLGRIPADHPRLFIRPEDVSRLRQLARGPLQQRFQQLVKSCDKLLNEPPPTAEPPTYPPGTVSHSEQWREIWWGNRLYTINALESAATLAFTRLLSGNEEYGQLARRILMDCAKWDPKGATGYRYNDEAGMPYAYHFSRTYTLVYDLLTEAEREQCRQIMKVRGDEMYKHLCPRHLWQPYASHSNRAWHFLGEIGIAFHGEVEGADDWAWFAANVFFNVYPVWSDDDGGWHEGSSYWSSYLSRFTWWADIMRATFGIDAYQKPFFATCGDYAMYLMPPGKVGGGFGDLTNVRQARSNVPLMSIFAAQGQNEYWQWYVEQMGGPEDTGGYVGFIRGTMPKVQARAPVDLPASKLFRGTGQAMMNTTLRDANEDVQIVFKSSPFGTQSHGYEANNSFLLWAYGQRLLIHTGYRDIYGSDHHRNWMWSTRSVNNITVDGQGQLPHSPACRGEITFFKTTPWADAVIGEAGECYRTSADSEDESRLLDRFTRAILFVKPDLIVIFDRLDARKPSTFEYWLHAVNQFHVADQHRIEIRAEDVVCPVDILHPESLKLAQTDQYDPNPRPRVKVREWHLTAATAEKVRQQQFVTLLRPQRSAEHKPMNARLKNTPVGFELTAECTGGNVAMSLPIAAGAPLAIRRLASDGSVADSLEAQP